MADSKKNPELSINSKRLSYLLDLFRLSVDELVNILNTNKKNSLITSNQLNAILTNGKIKLSTLKKIDLVFEKGLPWYLSDRAVPEKKSSSIFFRKDSFNSELNLESKKITANFEEKKFEIQALCALVDLKLDRTIKTYSIQNPAKGVAKDLRTAFIEEEQKLLERKIISKPKTDFDYLKNYVRILEEFNIFIFEFLETWNKKEKANFNGFFMYPNTIVIKRQKYYRREIFTLIHEFAHYLLNIEEIDENIEEAHTPNTSSIETWCNEFVYYFLANEQDQKIESITDIANTQNKYHEKIVSHIYDSTLLSKSAIYTRLKNRNKITQTDYQKILLQINSAINVEQSKKALKGREERALLKEQGVKLKGFSQKPISSRLYANVLKMNYFEGNLNESKLCEYLNVKPDRLAKELY